MFENPHRGRAGVPFMKITMSDEAISERSLDLTASQSIESASLFDFALKSLWNPDSSVAKERLMLERDLNLLVEFLGMVVVVVVAAEEEAEKAPRNFGRIWEKKKIEKKKKFFRN